MFGVILSKDSMYKICNIFLMLIFAAGTLFAQESKLTPAQVGQKQERVQYFLNRSHPEFAAALPYLIELHTNNPKEVALNYTLGFVYINLDDDRGLPYLEYCLKFPKELPDELYYYAGRAFHLQMKFKEAIAMYEKYRTTIKKPEKNQDKINEINHEITMCRNGIEMLENSTEIQVFSIGDAVNSEYPEYGPVFNLDGDIMMFTSCRPDTKGGKIDPFDGRYYEDIYISRKINDEWTTPENMGEPINTDGNDAVVSMSPDGQKMYIYRFVGGHGDLYQSRFDGNNWGEPQKLPAPINSNYWEPSMSITSDENTIFFSSNRPGGLGGTDIYMVKRLPNGEWAQPMNLGAPINTKYDEDAPFILSDGQTLYFSSNSDKSMGGFDVFVSHLEDGKWSEPENLGFPVSTPHDDLYFSVSTDGETMFFSSVRAEGKGDKDIYYAKIKRKSSNVMLVKGDVISASNKQPIAAHIEVTDLKTGELVGVYNTSSGGNYTIIFQEAREYHLEIKADGHKPFIDDLKVPDLQDFQMTTRNFRLMPLDDED